MVVCTPPSSRILVLSLSSSFISSQRIKEAVNGMLWSSMLAADERRDAINAFVVFGNSMLQKGEKRKRKKKEKKNKRPSYNQESPQERLSGRICTTVDRAKANWVSKSSLREKAIVSFAKTKARQSLSPTPPSSTASPKNDGRRRRNFAGTPYRSAATSVLALDLLQNAETTSIHQQSYQN